MQTRLTLVTVTVGLALATLACQRAPKTPDAVLARAVTAHGGERLGGWKTLTIQGHVEMQDGIAYNAAFLLQAKGPGRLRVEQDLTADRGRQFMDFFLSDGQAWGRRNLVVNRGNLKQMQRWLRHSQLLAYHVKHGTDLALQPEATVEWKEKKAGERTYTVVEARPAYVVSMKVDGEAVSLFVDKERFHLLQETWPEGRRVYHDFKPFEGVVFPTRVLEITKGRQGETVLPYRYERIALNQAIEDWVFAEDMPPKGRPATPGSPGSAAGR